MNKKIASTLAFLVMKTSKNIPSMCQEILSKKHADLLLLEKKNIFAVTVYKLLTH